MLGEAVALMRESVVDPQRVVDVMTESRFAAPVYKTYGKLIVEQQFQPAGFAMPLGLKDIRSALAAAEAQRVPMPVARVGRDHFITGIRRGAEDLDWSALARVAAEEAGIEAGDRAS